jgi:hypothetical protein
MTKSQVLLCIASVLGITSFAILSLLWITENRAAKVSTKVAQPTLRSSDLPRPAEIAINPDRSTMAASRPRADSRALSVTPVHWPSSEKRSDPAAPMESPSFRLCIRH